MKINNFLSIFLFSLALMCAGNLTNVLAKETTATDLDKAADAYNQKKEKDKYKVVCKREAPVGSRIKKRVCRTVVTMVREHEEAKRFLQRKRTSIGPQ